MEERSKRFLVGIYKLLARRARSKKEIIDWLNKRKTPEELQTEIIKKLESLKLLNDLSFAESFIRTRMSIRPRSVRVLKIELAQKGISKEIINEALSLNEVDEEKAAKELVEKNMWRWKKFDATTGKRRMEEFLMRKGFNFDVIKKIETQ